MSIFNHFRNKIVSAQRKYISYNFYAGTTKKEGATKKRIF